MSSSIGWEYIEINCDDSPTIDPNSTTTQSSTTTTFTTPPPTTTSTSTTSTTSTTTSTTSTTTSTTTSSTTSSTTTTTTTEAPTTTTSTTTTTTSSTTTTTTTSGVSVDAQFAVSFTTAAYIGTIVTAADVNAQNFDFVPDLGNGDFKGEIVTGPPTYTITLYVDTSGAGNPAFAAANMVIKIKDSIVGGTAIEVSPPGETSPGQITFVSSALDTTYNRIVLTEP